MAASLAPRSQVLRRPYVFEGDSLCQVVDHRLLKNVKKSSSAKNGSRKKWKSGCGEKRRLPQMPQTLIVAIRIQTPQPLGHSKRNRTRTLYLRVKLARRGTELKRPGVRRQ